MRAVEATFPGLELTWLTVSGGDDQVFLVTAEELKRYFGDEGTTDLMLRLLNLSLTRGTRPLPERHPHGLPWRAHRPRRP